ncbi:MAG: class I SAM-dependent methyltransferase [Candidatus Obscuribacterales bacterium]|jgi:caffeoyl-CoA O-methyltransferase|nr:class I SAM-dependent methyltransferase [Candidatus Obscuribacterales bacterium]
MPDSNSVATKQSMLAQYSVEHCEPVNPLLEEIVEFTLANTEYPQMLTGRQEGRLLKLLAHLCDAKRALEIGMFTGYSALSVAEALPVDGILITLDINQSYGEIARGFFDRSEHGDKIEIKIGPALDSIKLLAQAEEHLRYFDFVFIDADKPNYVNYYEAVLPLVRQNGLIVVDNVHYSGLVLDETDDTNARGIKNFNEHVKDDQRVDRVMLDIRDGIYLLRKR